MDLVGLTWRRGREAPQKMSAVGASVVHGNTAYFSRDNNVYSYTLAKDEWTTLPPCDYKWFSMAVVNDKVTTIGGRSGFRATNTLLCLEDQETQWREVLPPMQTARTRPAAVTTPTHLIVAGGETIRGSALSIVGILDTNTLQWSSAISSPEAVGCPHMTLCGEHLYLSKNNTIFSCSVEELLKCCKPASTKRSDSDSVWNKLADIPVQYYTSLTTLKGQILAIGGSEDKPGQWCRRGGGALPPTFWT